MMSDTQVQGMSIVILDELDQACKKAHTFVRDMFAMSKLPGSQLLIIGIANRMDLAERLLKGVIAADSNLVTIPFHSYSARQLLELLQVCMSVQKADKFLEHLQSSNTRTQKHGSEVKHSCRRNVPAD